MNTKIVFALVAAAFVTGMIIQVIPAEAAQKECKKDETSSCWIRVPQLFKSTINKLQSLNNHFSPPGDIGPPPDELLPELRTLLADMKEQTEELQMNQSDWEFLLERAG